MLNEQICEYFFVSLNKQNKINFKIFSLASHGVFNMTDIHLINEKTIKKEIVEQARQWLLYFCRLFPIESNDYLFFAIGHSAIRFIQRNRTIESYTFDRIERLSFIEGNSKMNLYLMKKKFTIQSNRVDVRQEFVGVLLLIVLVFRFSKFEIC